jgi:hypothetical protein
MKEQAIISNEKVVEFCQRQQRLEDKMSEVSDDVKYMRADFAKYRSDMGDTVSRLGAKMDNKIDTNCKAICNTLGEVENGRSVMSYVRNLEDEVVNTNHRIDKFAWAFMVVLAVIEFLANFPKITALIGK